MFNINSNLQPEGRRGHSSGLPRMSLTESVPGGGSGVGSGGGRGRGPSASGSPGMAARNSYVPKYSSEPQSGTDAINQDILRRVKAKFDSADLDGSGRLHPQEFINAFLGILQTEDGGDAEALAKLFMRIDANSDGTVDWDEFSTYMLLESQGSARVREFESTVTMQHADSSPVSDKHAHTDAMTHITSMRLANGVDRYATCGRDGTVRIWNAKDLKHIRTLQAATPTRLGPGGVPHSTAHVGSGSGCWATCSAFMPLTQKLAVGSFSRSIRIFDLASYEVAGQIPEIDYVPLSLDVWVPPRTKDCELVVVGDGGGWVRLFEVRASASGEDAKASGAERFTERPRWRYHHHTDWVMAVKYVPDMNCVLAASLDKTVSITDAEERVPLKKLEGHHHKGVNAVDWSSLYKFVVTASLDRRVIMWNPFSQKPLAVLNGHNAAVTGVVVNDRDNQIVSLSTDHMIKVWDIRNHKCIQSMPDRELQNMPLSAVDDSVTPLLYDSDRRQLITGHTRPKVWKMAAAGSGATKAHSSAVTRVMYNHNFGEAISADHSGTISVWHVPTGKLRYRFLRCHGDRRITSLAFDSAKRRLISGAEDGDCKIWNFSSGACLSHLQSRTRAEVTALVPLRGPLTRYVLAAGWDRRITFYEDNAAKAVGPGRALAGHKADILAMVALEGSSTVVTASDDGEVWVWNMDSCAPKRRMVAPGTASRPTNERAVEALAFLSGSGRLRSVLVAVGADRWMRLWDVLDGTLLAERFTGHRQSETIQALAVDGANMRIATGDSGGMVKVWDISRFSGGQLSHAAAAAAIREVALWRGHKAHVTSLDWVVLDARAAAAPGAGPGAAAVDDCGRPSVFLISSSADCTVTLWSDAGVRVGTFGQNTWALQERSTWADQEPVPLDERDTWIMEASRVIPRTEPAAPEPAADADAPAAGPRPLSPLSPLPHGGAGGGLPALPPRPDSAMPDEIALVIETSFAARAERRSSVRRLMSSNARAPSLTDGQLPPQQQPTHAQQQQPGAAGSAGGAPLVPSSRARSAAPPGGAAAAAGAAGGSGGGGPPVSERSSERPSGLRRSVSIVARAEGLVEESNSEEDGGESSASSGDHDSDGEVPAALWLHDFDAARNRRLPAEGSGGGPAGGARGYGAGRAGVAHLMKLTELAALQERPPTSYMSSRRGVATAAGVLTQAHGSPTRPASVSSPRRRA